MRGRLAAIAAAAAGTTSVAAPAADLAEGAFGWMAELAGHCWTAAYPDGTRDTQCYTTQFGRYLRGTIEIVAPSVDAAPRRRRGRPIAAIRCSSGILHDPRWRSITGAMPAAMG